MVKVTVGDLIKALQELPSNTEIAETTEYGRYDMETDSKTFLVYEKDSVIQLHLDDGQAYHAKLEPYRRSLFK